MRKVKASRTLQTTYPEGGRQRKQDPHRISEPAVELAVAVHCQPHQHRPAHTVPHFRTRHTGYVIAALLRPHADGIDTQKHASNAARKSTRGRKCERQVLSKGVRICAVGACLAVQTFPLEQLGATMQVASRLEQDLWLCMTCRPRLVKRMLTLGGAPIQATRSKLLSQPPETEVSLSSPLSRATEGTRASACCLSPHKRLTRF